MAETRRANPEYQLDVDLMTLEYLLYYAIHAQVKQLKIRSKGSEGDGDDADASESDTNVKAEKLLSMFDSSLHMFKSNHPSHPLGSETTYRIKVLELVVLFTQYRRYSLPRQNTSSAQSIAKDLNSLNLAGLDAEKQQIINHRQSWYTSRKRYITLRRKSSEPAASSTNATDIEERIISTWLQYQNSFISSTPDSTTSTFIPLIVLLSRFMELSAEIGKVVGYANEKWMILACEFMLQAALEALTPASSNGSLRATLADCFAWGFIPENMAKGTGDKSDSANQDRDEDAEYIINDMFRNREFDTDDDDDNSEVSEHRQTTIENRQEPEENPQWTKHRHDYLTEFHLPRPMTTTTLNDIFESRLSRLRQKYPYENFDKEFFNYLSGLWELSYDKELGGKPILVQIEGGSIDGLNEDEYQEFLDKVGIRNLDLKNSLGIT